METLAIRTVRFMKSFNMRLGEIEYLPKELIGAFAESYSLSFPENKLHGDSLIKHLDRKFTNSNFSNAYNIAALISNDEVIASGYGMIRNNYSDSSQNIVVGLVCDVFTHADFRKLGLFRKLSQLAIKREELTTTSFLIGFPVRDEVMPGHLSVGWKHIFNMPLWWGFPRFGSTKNVTVNKKLHASMFERPEDGISIVVSDEFLKWRFSLFAKIDYYFVGIPSSRDFAIVRKAKLGNLPFTCIVFMQSTCKENSKILIRKIRNLSLRIGTIGVLGCWNDSYAKDLFLETTSLKKSSKFQKVIVRELNDFKFPNDESEFRLSWIDSDTL